MGLAMLLGVACAPTAPSRPAGLTVRIALFEDLSVPDHLDLVSPSFLALEERLRASPPDVNVEVVQLDTGSDAAVALEAARRVAADESIVLAVAAPFWREPPQVAEALAAAGLPVTSLSTLARPPDGGHLDSTSTVRAIGVGAWLPFVPEQGRQARELVRFAEGVGQLGPMCLAGDGSPYAQGLTTAIDSLRVDSERIDLPGDTAAAGRAIAQNPCGVVIWTGYGNGAAALREAAGASPVIVASDASKTGSVLAATLAGSSTFTTCACADVTTSVEPGAQRFLNRYQAATGLEPGVYAVESWDLGGMILDAVRGGATDRGAMNGAVAGIRRYDGVAGTYRFAAARGPRPVGVFRASGTRWIPE